MSIRKMHFTGVFKQSLITWMILIAVGSNDNQDNAIDHHKRADEGLVLYSEGGAGHFQFVCTDFRY